MSSARWARVGCLVAVGLALSAMPADAATLRLDAGFGEGGIARVPFRRMATDVRPLPPVRQPDGKVLVAAAGYSDHGPTQILLARVTRSGRPDRSFGHRGRERLGLRWDFDPQDVHVQPDGRILVLGAAGFGPFFYPSPGQLGLVRLLPDGARDPSFGTNGFVTWNPPWRHDTVYLYALPGVFVPQPDGGMLAAGVVDELRSPGGRFGPGPRTEVRRVVFVRFNSAGAVDESFGHNGAVEGIDSSNVHYYRWAALRDGHLVAVASTDAAFGPVTFSLRRFTPDGAVDGGFGQDGSVGLGSEEFYAGAELVPTRDDSLVLFRGGAPLRIDPSGQFDAGFGSACGGPPQGATHVGAAATRDGGLLATATKYLRRASRQDSFVIPYGPDGCPEPRTVRLRGLAVGPPQLDGPRAALVAAANNSGQTYNSELALIRVRR